jgi:1-deoxy-D-xylulose-5-phosphate synthase
VAYLSTIPGMTILCPSSFEELRLMLEHALFKVRGPVAVRYPRGGEGGYTASSRAEGTHVLQDGDDVTLITYGTMVNEAITAAKLLAEQGVSARLLKLNSIRPLDMGPVIQASGQTKAMLVAEECVASGCVGQQIACRLLEAGAVPASLSLINLGDQFVTHGTVPQLRQLCGIDGRSIFQKAMEVLGRG